MPRRYAAQTQPNIIASNQPPDTFDLIHSDQAMVGSSIQMMIFLLVSNQE